MVKFGNQYVVSPAPVVHDVSELLFTGLINSEGRVISQKPGLRSAMQLYVVIPIVPK